MNSDLLAQMQRDGYDGTRKATTRGGEWQGACILPRCGGLGNDRLRVQPSYGAHGFFECRACGEKGSLVDYLIIKRGYTMQRALAEVGWKPKDGSEPHFLIPKSVLAGEVYPTRSAPPAQWQETAKGFVEYCIDNLWNEKGTEALDYLRSRGLKDETIQAAQLGYNPAKLRQSADKWGLQKHSVLASGIVIPWFLGEGEIWRVTIRDESVTEGANRYKQAAGGSNGLYLAFLLGYERPVVLVEGEIDALSIAQEAGHDVSVVATGSTEGAHTARWIAALAQKDLVLVAFDAEKRGDKAAQWWLDRIEHARRLRPWWKDANQMLQDGVDLLNDWILPSIDLIVNGARQIAMPSNDACHSCQKPFPSFDGWDPEKIPTGEVMNFDPIDGEMYCKNCRPELFNQMLETA